MTRRAHAAGSLKAKATRREAQARSFKVIARSAMLGVIREQFVLNDKLVLLIGVVLIVLSDSLPPSGWKWILPEGCELNVLAWYNLIEVFKIVSVPHDARHTRKTTV